MQNIKGTVRKMEDVGRICLPIEYRRALGLSVGEQLEIIPNMDNIIIRKPIEVDGVMQLEGALRTYDNNGRVVIPSEFRKTFKIDENTRLDMYPVGNTIVLKVVDDKCILCCGVKNLVYYNGEYVCHNCIDILLSLKPAV